MKLFISLFILQYSIYNLQSETLQIKSNQSVDEKVDSLFNQATTGEKKYDSQVKPSIDSLIAMGEKAIPRLIQKLNTKEAVDRVRLEDIFIGIGKPSVPYLIKYLNSNNPRGLRLSCYLLGKIGDTTATLPLLNLTHDKDWRIRASAIDGVGRLKDKRATYYLINALKDTVENVRRAAAFGLGELKDTVSIEPLLQALKDSYYGVRMNALQSIINIGKSAVNYIIVFSNTEKGIPQRLAIQSLGEIKEKKSIGILSDFSNSDDWHVRACAIEALGKMSSKKALKIILSRKKIEVHPFVIQKIETAEKNWKQLKNPE